MATLTRHTIARRRRLAAVFDRDGAACVWCNVRLTAEHPDAIYSLLVRAMQGGPSTPGNAVASCASCHARRGSRSAAHWLLICLDRDVRPNAAVVASALRELHETCGAVRADTGVQLQMLSQGRLPGEVGGEGRRRRLIARDGPGCVWCSKHLPATASDSTIEHLVPRGSRGPDSFANAMCACLDCNGRRGQTAVAAWVADCEARGLIVRRAALVIVLSQLASMGTRGNPLARQELRALSPGVAARSDQRDGAAA